MATKPGALPTLRRTVEIDLAALRASSESGESDEKIAIAISSEFPVERWFGVEILDHGKDAVVLERLQNGGALLLDHRTSQQIGVIEDVELGADRVLRGAMRFSKGALGQEIRQDVLDGIRRHVSVGYRIHDVLIENEGKKKETWRAVRWEPLEVSIVAVPADTSVGVGRSAEGDLLPVNVLTQPAAPAKERTVEQNGTTAAPEAAVTVRADRDAETQRTAQIVDLCEMHGMGARAAEFIRSGKPVGDVVAEIVTAKRGELKPTTPAATVKLTDREERQYSIARGIQGLLTGKRAGFEFEVSEQCAKELKRDTTGFFVPTSIRAQSPNPDAAPDTRLTMERTQLAVGTANKGAEAKFTEYGGFIDLLRNRARLLELGAQMLPGLQGDVAFVGQTGSGVAGWNAETVNQALSSLSMALRSMAPKGLQSATTYTRKLLLQSVFAIENLVRNDVAMLHALEIDRAGINGSGADDEPRGILNTAGIGSVAIGTNGGAPTYDHIVDLETEVAVDNVDGRTFGYLTNARMRGKLKKTPEMANTAALPVWRGTEVNGYPAAVSNQVPSNLTKGTSTDCSAIIYGAYGEMIIGEWGAMEVLVDQITLGPSIVKLMSIQFIDIFLRYVEAFAAIKDARHTV